MAFVFKFPDLGEGVHEGKIVRWLVKEGDTVKADQVMAEAETDKAVVEMPCPQAGTILKIYYSEGQIIQVGSDLMVIGKLGEAIPPQSSTGHLAQTNASASTLSPTPIVSTNVAVASVQPVPATNTGSILATPVTRQLARELNVDLSKVKGTGPGGRIMPDDVKAFASSSVALPSPIQSNTSSKPPQTPLVLAGPTRRVAFSTLRKAVSNKMTESWTNIPQATHFEDSDVTNLWNYRESVKTQAISKGVNVTLLPFIVKATVELLKKYPVLNSSIDISTNEIVLKDYYNIGIAVDVEDGLVVVVVRDADKLSVLEIARLINSMAQKARERKTSLEDIRGGTFTITNIGSIGGTGATPIINFPETAILGLYRTRDKPVVKEGNVVVRKIMPFSLGFDHRIIDGALAARFSNDFATMLDSYKFSLE